MKELTKDERDQRARSIARDILDRACAADGHRVVVLNECACGKRAKAKVRGVISNDQLREVLEPSLPYRD